MDRSSDTQDSEPPARRQHAPAFHVIIMRDAIRGRVPRAILQRLATRVGQGERLRGFAHLIIVGDSEMKRLNHRHLGKNRPTDVLSFPLNGHGESHHVSAPMGEVYCNIDHARRWSAQTGETQSSELARLMVHGLLHLAGYDHHTARDRATMTGRENRYLRASGLIDRRLKQGAI